jgi:precorrin isomerase
VVHPIEQESFRRLRARLDTSHLPPLTRAVVERVIHSAADLDYATDLLPALILFSLGLAATVAPLTATVLADADESNAGIASGVNNAIARVASLLCVAALGAVVAAQASSSLDSGLAGRHLDARAAAMVAQARHATLARVDPTVTGAPVAAVVEHASVQAFHLGIGIAAGFVALGGTLGLAGIRNPRRVVRCAECPGGAFAGGPRDVAVNSL